MMRGMYRTKAQNLCRAVQEKSYKRFGKGSGSNAVAKLCEMMSGRPEGNQLVGRCCVLPEQQQTQRQWYQEKLCVWETMADSAAWKIVAVWERDLWAESKGQETERVVASKRKLTLGVLRELLNQAGLRRLGNSSMLLRLPLRGKEKCFVLFCCFVFVVVVVLICNKLY